MSEINPEEKAPNKEGEGFSLTDSLKTILCDTFNAEVSSKQKSGLFSELNTPAKQQKADPAKASVEKLKESLQNGNLKEALELQADLAFSRKDLQRNGIRELLLEAICQDFMCEYISYSPSILKSFHIDEKTVSRHLLEKLKEYVSQPDCDIGRSYRLLQNISNVFGVDRDQIVATIDSLFSKIVSTPEGTIYFMGLRVSGYHPSDDIFESVRCQALKTSAKLAGMPNTGDQQYALHSYFRFRDSESVRIFGDELCEAIREQDSDKCRRIFQNKYYRQKYYSFDNEAKLRSADMAKKILSSWQSEAACDFALELGWDRALLESKGALEAASIQIALSIKHESYRSAYVLAKNLDLIPEYNASILKRTETLLENHYLSDAKQCYHNLESSCPPEDRQKVSDLAFPIIAQQIIDGEGDSDKSELRELCDYFKIPPEKFSDQAAIAKISEILKLIDEYGAYSFCGIVEDFNDLSGNTLELPEEVVRKVISKFPLSSLDETLPMLLEAAKFSKSAVSEVLAEQILELASEEGWSLSLDGIVEGFEIPEELFRTETAQAKMRQAAEISFSENNIDSGKNAIKLANISGEDFKEVAITALAASLANGHELELDSFGETFQITLADIRSEPEFHQAALQGLRSHIRRCNFAEAEKLCSIFQFSSEELDSQLPRALAGMCSRSTSGIDQIQQFLGVIHYEPQVAMAELTCELDDYQRYYVDHFKIETLAEFIQFEAEHQEYLNWLLHNHRTPRLSREELGCMPVSGAKMQRDKLPLSAIDADCLKGYCEGIDLNEIHSTKDYSTLRSKLGRNLKYWKYLEHGDFFPAVAKIIGDEAALRLAFEGPFQKSYERAGTFFRGAYRLLEKANLPPETLYQRVLLPVVADKGEYGVYNKSRRAYQEFDSIFSNYRFRIQRLIDYAKPFADIKEVSEAIKVLSEDNFPFNSWNNLKLYVRCCNIFDHGDRTKALVALQQSNPGLFSFLVSVCLKPDSRINRSTINEFWENPADFLARLPKANVEEVYNPDLTDLMGMLRPSLMVDGRIEHLDLTSCEMRDSLLDGTLDSLQRFSPLSVEYQVPKSGIWYESTQQALKAALGQRELKNGRAKNAGTLFTRAKKYLKSQGVDLLQYLSGKVELKLVADRQLQNLIYDKKFGIQEEYSTIVATVHTKSDPRGISAADDTASCMPFGSVKGNIYLFDPNLAYFTLSLRTENGELKTISQSVLTKDTDVKTDYGQLYLDMKSCLTDLSEKLSECPDNRHGLVIGCDNIQMAPNFKKDSMDAVVQAVYRNFFAEYTARYGKAEGLDSSWVAVGRDYSAGIDGLPTALNKWMPINAPIGYSDRNQDSRMICRIDLEKGRAQFRTKVLDATKKSVCSDLFTADENGLRPMLSSDVLPAAYISGKELRRTGKSDIIEGVQTLKVNLAAIEINNAKKGRPNLSTIAEDQAGKAKGYLLAFEGRNGDKEPVIVVRDFISDSPRTAYKLLTKFIDQYREIYGSQPDAPKVVLQFPKDSSENSLKTIKRFAEKHGLSCTTAKSELRVRRNWMMREFQLRPVQPQEAVV